jgi:long-chain acyl-CoA synthetase
LIKSDAVSRGYWRNPEQTAETFVDGWLHTGDIGTFSDDGYLSIIDRKKEIIINAAGKNMSPSNIEAAIKWADPLIAEVCVVGDGRPYNVALITLDPMYAPEWAKKRGLPHSVAELSAHPDLRAAIRDAVDRGNARLSRVESIKRFEVLTSAWLPGGDELTMTLKLKRRQIDAKYNELIDSIYGRAQ